MMNIMLTWDAPLNIAGVTGYAVYHGNNPAAMTLVSNIVGSPMVVYPSQLGYLDGDTVHLAVATINPTGQSERVQANAVILPVTLSLPSPPTNVVAALV